MQVPVHHFLNEKTGFLRVSFRFGTVIWKVTRLKTRREEYMDYFLRQFMKNVETAPDAPFLYDEMNRTGLSYARFDDMTGRVYAWLKTHGIGREDFVLLNLPSRRCICDRGGKLCAGESRIYPKRLRL